MMNIKDINPLTDEWDTSMLDKFNNEQLIFALHKALNDIFDVFKVEGLGRLARLFFNSIIIEIKKRMV